MQSKTIIRVALGTGLILLIPLTLQLTIGTGVDGQGFNWKLGDFVVMGILLFSVGLVFSLAMRKFRKHRIIIGALIVLAFLYIWAELAVGILNIPGISGS